VSLGVFIGRVNICYRKIVLLILKERASSSTSSLGFEGSTNGLVKNGLETLLGQRRALHHLVASNFLAEGEGRFVSDGCLLLGGKLLDGGSIFSQINLGSDQDEGNVGAVVRNLRIPLGPQVLEGRRIDDGIGQKEDVGLGI